MGPRLEGSGQTMDYTETVKWNGHTLRIRIHLDSYAAQAWGHTDRWDGSQWQNVVMMAGSSLTTRLDLGYARMVERTLNAFQRDRDHLLNLAMEVL